MTSKIRDCDKLRLAHQIYEPDSRTHGFVYVNKVTGEVTSKVVEDQHRAVARFSLNETAPIDVAIHFETARNLYLYAWFVYRFYPVAEQQVLASLEFALRERFPEFVANEKKNSRAQIEPGLKKLLKYAISEGVVTNQNFLARERWARERAESRYRNERRELARRAGLESWEEDLSEAVISEEDLNFNWLSKILDILPSIRNDYAHGAFTLHPNVLQSFELVSEIINQLYPKAEEQGA